MSAEDCAELLAEQLELERMAEAYRSLPALTAGASVAGGITKLNGGN